MYTEREGHCRVPLSHKENGFRLGQWVGNQRNNKKIYAERRQRLDEIGFVWDHLAADWEDGLHCLRMYKEREGHCRVPQAHKENSFPLGRWVARQRQNKDGLSEGRRQGLEELGFIWNVRQPRSRSSPVGDHRVPEHEAR
jgi:Helicase associated domain